MPDNGMADARIAALEARMENQRLAAEVRANAYSKTRTLIKDYSESLENPRKTTKRKKREQAIQHEQKEHQPFFLRFCESFKYLFSNKVREQIFVPSLADLIVDYVTYQSSKNRTRITDQWLKTCFFIRVTWMVVQCFFYASRNAAWAAIAGLFSPHIKSVMLAITHYITQRFK